MKKKYMTKKRRIIKRIQTIKPKYKQKKLASGLRNLPTKSLEGFLSVIKKG